MIWADRIGAVWALAVIGIVIAVNEPSTDRNTVIAVILIPWLLMRAFDWIITARLR